MEGTALPRQSISTPLVLVFEFPDPVCTCWRRRSHAAPASLWALAMAPPPMLILQVGPPLVLAGANVEEYRLGKYLPRGLQYGRHSTCLWIFWPSSTLSRNLSRATSTNTENSGGGGRHNWIKQLKSVGSQMPRHGRVSSRHCQLRASS